ncbi:MAG: outer membrane lipoprotein carrier protein LolA [Gammaproteobacteria bacterium]
MTARLVFVLLLLPFPNAQAADLLGEIDARLERAEITQGSFRQEKKIRVLKKPLISTGVFTYHRRKGAIWKTLTPVPSVVLVNERRVITRQGEQALPEAFGRVFTAMLGGDLSLLAEGFETSGSHQHATWRLQLIPKEDMLKKLSAGIELTGDKALRLLDITEANGNFTRLSFERISHPAELTPEQETEFDRLSSPR